MSALPEDNGCLDKTAEHDIGHWPLWKEWVAVFCVVVFPQIFILGPALIGKTLLYPLDLLALERFYLPKSDDYATVVPNNRHLTDVVLSYPAQREFVAMEYGAGRIPLWNPYNFLGAPCVLSTKYSPFELPLVLWRSPVGIAWQQLVQGFLAGVGCYVFLRRVVRVGPLAALPGTACYPWTGFFVLWQGYPLTHAASLLPWMLIATHFAVTRPTGWGALGLAVLSMLTVFSCVDIAGQVLLVSGLYSVFLWWFGLGGKWWSGPFWMSVMTTVVAWSLGLVACSVFLLPFVEYVKSGVRMQERFQGTEERPPVGISVLPLLLLPDAFGSAKQSEIQISGGNQFESAASAYAGLILTLFLVPLAWSSQRHRRLVLFFVFIAILGMSWQLNLPGFVQILRWPPFNMMSHNRFVFATGFSLIVLSAIGGQALVLPDMKFRWWYWIPITIAAAFAVWCLARWVILPAQLQGLIATGKLRPAPKTDVLTALRNCAMCHARGFGLSVIASFCWLLAGRAPEVRKGGLCVIGLLALIEVLSFASRETRQSDPRLYFPQVPALAAIHDHPAGRVMGIGCLPPSLNIWHRLSDVRGYDGVDPKPVLDLFHLGADPRVKSPSYARTQWAAPVILEDDKHQKRMSPIWDMLNVRYFIMRSEPPAGLPVIIHIDDYWVFENKRALGRTFVPKNVIQLASAVEVYRELGTPGFDPGQVAFTTEDTIETVGPVIGDSEIVAENSQSIEILADMKTSGIVVLSDLWDKGWVADVDGKATPIHKVNHCLRAVDLTPGKHRIVMHYEPQSFHHGLNVTFFAIGGMTIWFMILLIVSITGLNQRPLIVPPTSCEGAQRQ